MNITIVGCGYVGLANAVLLARSHRVTAVDVAADRVERINARRSPLADREIEEYLSRDGLNLRATTDCDGALAGADYVVIATPTDYDSTENTFDTSSVEGVVERVMAVNPGAVVVIDRKSVV